MVYISSIGPVDPETGEVILGTIKEQTRQCLANLQAAPRGRRQLARERRLGQLVAARTPTDFDEFNEEWNRWFPGDPPIGQCTIMPPLQRRAGFGVSLGVIATL